MVETIAIVLYVLIAGCVVWFGYDYMRAWWRDR